MMNCTTPHLSHVMPVQIGMAVIIAFGVLDRT
jgi:hypothetical protein